MKHYIHTFFFLTILNILCPVKGDANKVTIGDFNISCHIHKVIDKDPPRCTSLAVSANNKDILNQIKTLKSKLPIMFIEDSKSYLDWINIFQNDKPLTHLPQDISYNMIAFANMYNIDETAFNVDFNTKVINFFDQVKKNNPNILYGIIIPNHKQMSSKSLDYIKLNDHIDFVIIMSNDLTDCMSDFDYTISSTSYNDIATYVRSFINGGFSSKKILFSTKILFNSVKKSGLSDHHKNMDYYEFCDGKKSDSRGFCDTPIQDFYNEGILRVEANLAGIFVEYAMSDDYDAKCGCAFQSTDKDKSFPILRLLADAGKTLFDDYQCDIKRVTIKPLGSHF